MCRAGVFTAWHFILLHRGPARPLLLLTAMSASWPRTERRLRAVGSAPTAQMEPLYRRGQPGRTFWPGDPRSNPPGARTDRSCCLLSTACLKTNRTLRRETCEVRRARLPRGDAVCSASSTDRLLCGRSLPDRAHNYDHLLRPAPTEPARGSVRQV